MTTVLINPITTTDPARVPVVVKPPRYNFAGFCIVCERWNCRSVECATYHAASVWGVCPKCHGRAPLPKGPLNMRCGKCGGVFDVGWGEAHDA